MPILNLQRNRTWRCQFFLAIALLYVGREASAQPTAEYEFKAVFLFHFAQFVEWPSNTFSNAQAPLVIGVLGDNPFDGYLAETIRGETVDGHSLVVQNFHKMDDVTNCQVLFVSRSETRQLPEILAALKGKNILSVSDIEKFPEDGGIIGFATVNDKIHFRINTSAAGQAHLTFSSKLLRLAEIVTVKK